MKQSFGLMVAIAWQTSLIACNICGASYTGINQSVGMLQSLNKSLILGSLQTNRFENYNNSPLNLNTLQLSYSQFVNSKVQVSYYLPYRFNQENNQSYSGIGDASIGFNYRWLDTRDSVFSIVKHFSMVQASVSLPTGKYQLRDDSKTRLPVLLQPGTGSFGYHIGMMYACKYLKWGAMGMYRFGYFTENELGYQLAQKQTVQFSVFKVFSKGNWSIMPQINVVTDWNNADMAYNTEVNSTSGKQSFIGLQLEASIKQCYFNLGYQKVIQQTQYESANLYKDKLLITAGFLF